MSTKSAAKKAKPSSSKDTAKAKKAAPAAVKASKATKELKAKPVLKEVKSKVDPKAKPTKVVAKEPTKSPDKKAVAEALKAKKAPMKNAAEAKAKAGGKAKTQESEAPIKETFSPKLLNAKSNNKNDSLKFKEPHELFEGQEASEDGASDDKKEKKIKGVNFKMTSGQEKDKWQELNTKLKSQKSRAYSMREVYEPHTILQHKVLGWGVILSVNNDRLEVLFKEGIKFLISNYNP